MNGIKKTIRDDPKEHKKLMITNSYIIISLKFETNLINRKQI